MAPSISLTDPIIVYTAIGCTVVVLVILFVLLSKKRQKTRSTGFHHQGQGTRRLAYQPEPPKVPVICGTAIPRPKKKLPAPEPAVVQEIPLIHGRADLPDSMDALVEKYRLDQITIATDDGLVFAAGGGGDAASDAARFGGAADDSLQEPDDGNPAREIFSHRGSRLFLIIRSARLVPEGERERMVEDTKAILNWWI